MNDREQQIAEHESCQYTNSTALAAALASLGFQFKKARSLIRTYTEKRPPGTLGVFHFRLNCASPEFPTVDCTKLRESWYTREAEAEFDKLKAEIAETASAGVMKAAGNPTSAKSSLEIVQQKYRRLLELLPAYILCFQSRMEENHNAIKAKMKEVCRSDADHPRRQIKIGKSVIDIPANLSDEEAAAMLARFQVV
jgi:hypothetical protein